MNLRGGRYKTPINSLLDQWNLLNLIWENSPGITIIPFKNVFLKLNI
jgi:hypothetical protein